MQTLQMIKCFTQIHLVKLNLFHSLGQAARDISIDMKSDKTEFMCFKQDAAISTLNGKPLKFVDQFIYLGSNISSTERDANLCIGRIMKM